MKLCSSPPLDLVDARSFRANGQHLCKFMEEKSIKFVLKREESPQVPEMWELQIALLLYTVITVYFASVLLLRTHLLQNTIEQNIGLWKPLA